MCISSETIDALVGAHSAFLADVYDPDKSNQAYGYKYADLSDLLKIARPLLASNGLSVVQFPSFVAWPKEHHVELPDVKGFIPYLVGEVRVESTLSHSSGQWMRDVLIMPVETKKGMSLAQCIGMAITYARRYSFAAIVGMTQADDDAAMGGFNGSASAGAGAPQGGRSAPPRPAGQQRNPAPRQSRQAPPMPEASVPVITADQAADLRDGITAIGRDPVKFAQAAAGVNRIEDIPAARFDTAMHLLTKASRKLADESGQESGGDPAPEAAGPSVEDAPAAAG